ncbi:MAG: S41 family peptidase [Bacteroidales bacterium]
MKYNNTNRSIYLPIIIAASLVIGLLAGIYLPRQVADNPALAMKGRSSKINDILRIIGENYVDTVNRNQLEEAAIPAILKKLDPHSIYIPARDLKKANEPLQGNFDGIGISFNLLTDTILVLSTIPGGPSEKAGLMAGDKIIFVNDSLVAGNNITDDKAMSMLKGPRGTMVRIKILRKGMKDLLAFEIKRDKIPIYSVDVAYMVDESTGYIKINAFALTTYDEFMKALRELKGMGMNKLIVDLRGNSGGIMEAAIRIANQFLKKGDLIVYTEGRAQPRNDAIATGSGEFEEGKLVVLIDEWSASASEILAGAVQDNDRATIIGRRSFGKGLVQEPVMFTDGSGLRLTIARYYTPTGRSIQKPYDQGTDKYYEEMQERMANGELLKNDSIHYKNGKKYVTPGGRILYGGGGITPDIFIPIDTTGTSMYFARVRINLIYRFALDYTERNRTMLQKFPNLTSLVSFLDGQALLDQFVTFAEKNGVKRDPRGIETSGRIIKIQIKAYIARNIFENKGFYPVWEELDTTLKKAIQYIEENQTVK